MSLDDSGLPGNASTTLARQVSERFIRSAREPCGTGTARWRDHCLSDLASSVVMNEWPDRPMANAAMPPQMRCTIFS